MTEPFQMRTEPECEFVVRVLHVAKQNPDSGPIGWAKELGCRPRDVFLALRKLGALAEKRSEERTS
jgi:hypothetical protein